ncbi:MAG: PEP-CTERM sorting domain-containing protein [Acidobacteria bacterium]|nr:PEP-CTERM sorting domain-containing protein [Acidobacteriota bacterium]
MTPRTALFVSALVLGLAPAGLQAGFVTAVDYSGSTSLLITSFSIPRLGYTFTVGSNPVNVVALGLNVGSTALGANVRIYRNGTTTNLLSATINNSDSLSGDGRFRYETVSPYTLLASTSYTILADLPNSVTVRAHATGITTVSGITFVAARGGGSGVPFPLNDGSGNGPYFGPAFELQAAVPEPSSFSLIGIAILAAGLWKARKFAFQAAMRKP